MITWELLLIILRNEQVVKLHMKRNIRKMLEKFKHKNELKYIKKTSTPAADHFFEINPNCNKLGVTANTISNKQKLNTKSSTEPEVVAADDSVPLALWARSF